VRIPILGIAFLSLASLIFAPGAKATALSSARTAIAQQTPEATPPLAQPQQNRQQRVVTVYTLPPDLYRKARNIDKLRFAFELIAPLYGIAILWLILQWRAAPKFRDWAEKSSSRRLLQALIFVPLITLAIDVLSLPTGIAQNWVERVYGLSVQGWGSWAWDWTKGELVSIITSTILVLILYAVIRRSPRRWWFYFWLASLPLLLVLIFLQPLVIDPLFHKFEPLQRKDPALTVALEKMVQRAGENIPPERMFWMGASEKSTTLNAYVTGFGASKRIVVWDTTIAKMDTPQIVMVTGHEMGHYVLHHIPKELGIAAAGLFAILFIGYRTIGWLLARRGARWDIRGVDDWASLPALLLLFSVLSFIATPISNFTSRYFEHQADQYGLEVTHGLTPDSGEVAAQMFQILGETNLSDPAPSRLDILLTYDHPSIPDRVRYCLTYNPWAYGGHGEFVP
jgi:STE24 endopeptidase